MSDVVNTLDMRFVLVKDKEEFDIWCNQTPENTTNGEYNIVSGSYIVALFKGDENDIKRTLSRGFLLFDGYDADKISKSLAVQDYVEYCLNLEVFEKLYRLNIREYVNKRLGIGCNATDS